CLSLRQNRFRDQRAGHTNSMGGHLQRMVNATGLVVTHVVGTKQCQRMVMEGANFKETIEEKPIIWVDLALQITAPLQGEVDTPKVRAVIYRLAQLGMQFGSHENRA
ncbi:MAG: hypothetical protein LAP21_07635, partial [Acidobacteriia bacterium]|nr:hypothetical protein [Terriglobia bacterium]